MFFFRKQPWKLLYLSCCIAFTLCIQLPYFVIIGSVPRLRPRRSWTLVRYLGFRWFDTWLKIFYHIGFPNRAIDPHADYRNRLETGFDWVEPAPEGMIIGDVAEMARRNDVHSTRVYGYWYGLNGKEPRTASEGERVLYFFHGGAYVMGTSHPKDIYTIIPRDIMKTCGRLVHRTFSLQYRLAASAPYPSANPFPAPLLDALAGYRYLVHVMGFEPRNIIVVGDSAGGHLAISLARYLKESSFEDLPGPGALLLLSPVVDWGWTHHDGTPGSRSSTVVNSSTDFLYTRLKNGYCATSIRGSLAPSELKTSAWLSPASLELPVSEGLFSGFPPTCVVAGGAEQGVDSMRTLRDSLRRDNGDGKIAYLEYADAMHDFMFMEWHEPERTHALGEIRHWLCSIYGH